MTTVRTETPLAYALAYARRGLRVIPLHNPDGQGVCSCGAPACDSPAKHPRTRHGLKDGTTNPSIIKHWWRDHPRANIGIVTGADSGVVALDIDPAHGGRESLLALEEQYGPRPLTVQQTTGGGGEHELYAHPGGVIRNDASRRLGLGLDIRGDGGYIVAPPSIHISGVRYEWEGEHHIGDLPFAPLPAWMTGLLRTPTAAIAPADGSPIPKGGRNDTLASYAGSMRRRGMGEAAIAAALQVENAERCQPPLSENEVRDIARAIARYEPAEAMAPTTIEYTPGRSSTNGHYANAAASTFIDSDVFYEAIVERLSDVEPEPLSWLWEGRILANKITLIGGDPAVGKGFVTMDISARATMGKPWPDQLGVVREPVNVLWMTTEDAGADTLRPRMEAAGGDARRLFNWKGIKKIKLDRRLDTDGGESAARRETQLSIHLQRDAEVLEKLLRQYEIRMLIVDPITGYLPGSDIFRDNEIRAVLGPLATVADELKVAVLPVMHLNKTQGGQALKRFLGSVAFGAQARMAYLIAPDPDDPEKRVFLQVKNNVSKKADGLRFQIVDYRMRWREGLDIDTAKVEWLMDEPVYMDADDIVGDDSGKLSEAIAFLTDYLADGAHAFEDIERECKRRAIAIKTLRRASRRLRIEPAKAQGQPHGAWWWSIPAGKTAP